MTTPTVRLMAGVPKTNLALYRQIRFLVGDPAAYIEIEQHGRRTSTLILRDIEMDRARQHARADSVACPRDFEPLGGTGLSGDRETATAQATAECLRRAGISEVVADRSLPLLYVHILGEAGITVRCDPELGVVERRAKDAEEVEHLRACQQATEGAIELACRMIARAQARSDGVLMHAGSELTSERVRQAIDVWLLEQGYQNPDAIVAGGPIGADCHHHGSGVLRTEQPIIVDIFPRNRTTLYNGDCTRTVVHGAIPPEVAKMHAAVVKAKEAAIAATRAGVTGEAVHLAAIAVIRQQGYEIGLPPAGALPSYCGMVHGTGHGIGLDVHEPPLLDKGGPALVVGDALTIEPGLYSHAIGGIRVEDMVIVTADGCENLNRLPAGLCWT